MDLFVPGIWCHERLKCCLSSFPQVSFRSVLCLLSSECLHRSFLVPRNAQEISVWRLERLCSMKFTCCGTSCRCCDVVPVPKGVWILRCHFVYKVKYKDSKVDRLCSWLFALIQNVHYLSTCVKIVFHKCAINIGRGCLRLATSWDGGTKGHCIKLSWFL